MKSRGVRVIRWWLWPDFRGDGIRFTEGGEPRGLGSTVVRDLHAALALAREFDMYLILCVFSFDNFRNTRIMGGIRVRGMAPMVRDPLLRAAMMKNVVRPLALAVRASPHRKRLLAWDLMNEPEWAMSGPGRKGDRPYFPLKGVDAVSHGEMFSFLRAMTKTIRGVDRVPISIGQAALAWRNAFKDLDPDFYQFHVYDWMNREWPMDRGPAAYGLADKPVLIGEMPLGPLGGRSFRDSVRNLRARGYAGALPWSFSTLSRKRLKSMPPRPFSKLCGTR